ncbi:MAG TPA: hypothetical protein VG123_28940, partial [Streptosporangiaceae bacterium]|nr:hypothetical protein [Streptosporangiaceae bacterium]
MWNTSFLLPATLFAPLTLLIGPQATLTVLLTLGFAGTAMVTFLVLRRWAASLPAAALGGALFGFSPALRIAAVGHYHLQFAILLPLIVDALLCLFTGRGRPVRTGAWLGLLLAAQLFIAEETLALLGVTAGVIAVVLALSRPRAVAGRIRGAVAGIATAAGVMLVLSAYGLWRQFHGPLAEHGSPWTPSHYHNFPGNFVSAPSGYLFTSPATVTYLNNHPVKMVEYFAYLGWPMLAVLLIAAVLFWRDLRVRTMAVTFAVLELCSLGSKTIHSHGVRWPAALLPWHYLARLPLLDQALANRFSLLADGLAAALLAFAVDLACRPRAERPARRAAWARGIAVAAVAVAIVPIIPLPLQTAPVRPIPAGFQQAFSMMKLSPDERVVIIPLLPSADMRWQADSNVTGALVGCYGIAPEPSGKAAICHTQRRPTAAYLNALQAGETHAKPPSSAQLRADLGFWKLTALVAVTSRHSALGKYLTRTFGPATIQRGSVLAWRHYGPGYLAAR